MWVDESPHLLLTFAFLPLCQPFHIRSSSLVPGCLSILVSPFGPSLAQLRAWLLRCSPVSPAHHSIGWGPTKGLPVGSSPNSRLSSGSHWVPSKPRASVLLMDVPPPVLSYVLFFLQPGVHSAWQHFHEGTFLFSW